MKKYEPAQMVASSRYQNYFPTPPTEIQQDVYGRMNELLMEEKEYCDKGNYAHMSQILTSIALYEVLQKHGYSEEDACAAILHTAPGPAAHVVSVQGQALYLAHIGTSSLFCETIVSTFSAKDECAKTKKARDSLTFKQVLPGVCITYP